MNDTLAPDEVLDDEEISDNDEFSHYVKVKALVKGGSVTALCGKRYVPKTLLVDEYPICPKCKEAHAWLGAME